MSLSVTEVDYLRTSLASTPVVRPDSRRVEQFRPVDAEIDILPMANGSSRIRAADGGECIVGVKAKVVAEHADLVDVSVEVTTNAESDALANSLAVVLKQVLDACPELTQGQLILNPKYAFRLFVDCIVLSHTSHPLSLLSLGVYQALKSTRLPKKLGVYADNEIVKKGDEAEIPQFDDDWSQAVPLCPAHWSPPLVFIVAVVGNTVLVDPTLDEEQVAEASLFFTWKNGCIAAPIRTLDVGSGPHVGSFDAERVFEAYALVEQCAVAVQNSLAEA